MANSSLMEALEAVAKEKNIPKEVILEEIHKALEVACKQSFMNDKNEKTANYNVLMDYETGEYHVLLEKTVVEHVSNPNAEITIEDAQDIDGSYQIGDVVNVELKSQEFGRIAASAARNVLMQGIHEEENKILKSEYEGLKNRVITGIIQRKVGKNYTVDLGKVEATLSEREQIRGESYNIVDRYKFYVLDVKENKHGLKIFLSRTHRDLVRSLFEEEVSEIREGIVEIKNIAREAGNRTKMAVWSNDENVDPVGACVGMNGARVNAVVAEINDEKIDIINWDENPARLIENALSPAKVISVIADSDEETAKVVVPDYQLSLAIGREGQNARLAAKLTGYKIDIKSETQARESGDFFDYDEYDDEEYYDDEEGYDEEIDETV